MSRQRSLTRVVHVRFTPAQLEVLDQKAREAGVNRSLLVRRATLGLRIRRDRALRQQTAYQLARLGNNLNQLTRVANTTGRIESVPEIENLLGEIREAVARVLPEDEP